MNYVTKLLSARFTYAELAAERNPNEIVYTENDVIEMLQLLGFVQPFSEDSVPLFVVRAELAAVRNNSVAENTNGAS